MILSPSFLSTIPNYVVNWNNIFNGDMIILNNKIGCLLYNDLLDSEAFSLRFLNDRINCNYYDDNNNVVISFNSTGNIQCNTLTVTSSIQCNTLTVTSSIQCNTLTVTSSIQCNTLTVTSSIQCNTLTVTSSIQCNTLSCDSITYNSIENISYSSDTTDIVAKFNELLDILSRKNLLNII